MKKISMEINEKQKEKLIVVATIAGYIVGGSLGLYIRNKLQNKN